MKKRLGRLPGRVTQQRDVFFEGASAIESLKWFSQLKRIEIMLSEIERIFPTICTNMKIDIDEIVSVRKNRSKLFNEQYFTNKFWDIILLLYSHEINALPIDANGISRNLDLNHRAVLRYLEALSADGIICAYDETAEDSLNLACDNLSLTRLGFENAGTIVQQTRRIFAASTKP